METVINITKYGLQNLGLHLFMINRTGSCEYNATPDETPASVFVASIQ